MDEETLANATTPFFTTKGVGKGTGLGLPMVQGLMEQSKGKLILRSKAGEGTTAELWLPTAVANNVVTEAQPDEEAPRFTAPLTVLAVDDDPLVLMNTVMMLEDMGHTVIEANSAPRALAILAEERVDMIVTDHAMPRMTGADLAKTVKEKWPDIPIVIATGYAELPPGYHSDLIRISKPFGERQLADAIGKCLQMPA